MSIKTVFDLETSGLPKFYINKLNDNGHNIGPYKDIYIYSAAFIVFIDQDEMNRTNKPKKVEKYILVKPKRFGKDINVEMTNIHGLDKSFLDKNGIEFAEFCNYVTNLINKSCQFIGHNVLYDLNVLLVELDRVKNNEACQLASKRLQYMINQKYYFCTANRIGKKLSPSKKLEIAYKELTGEEAVNCHNALSDAQMCFELYLILINK